AKTTRTTPGASRAIHGEREGHLAGPDGVSPLGGGPKTGRPRGRGPLRRDFRWPVFEPALPRFRDGEHNPGSHDVCGRGRLRRRPEREARRTPRRPYLGRAGAAKPRVGKEVPLHPRGGTLGARRRRDRRGGHLEVRGGHLDHQRPPPRRISARRRLAWRGNAGVPQRPLRPGGTTRHAARGQRVHYTPAMGADRTTPARSSNDGPPRRRARRHDRRM
ncbi:hypothetical protein AVDCRST_MAG82-2284, partial [uncultured Rubrobacteraceae bacterium]